MIVLTNDFFVSDSTFLDIKPAYDIIKSHEAVLMLDVSDSLFFNGEKGYSQVTKLEDKDNIFIVGSGSKALGVNLGFLVAPTAGQSFYNKFYSPSLTFTNAIPPNTCATAIYNLTNLVLGNEGAARRKRLIQNAVNLRNQLKDAGFKVVGDASGIVLVEVGSHLLARVVTNLITEHGVCIGYLEYPEVPAGEARLRFNVQAHHTNKDINILVSALKAVVPKAEKYLKANAGEHVALAEKTVRNYSKL